MTNPTIFMRYKEYIPPALVHLARRFRSTPSHIYSSYSDAIPHCGSDTYEADSIAEVVFAKTAALSATLSDPRRLIGTPGLVNLAYGILVAQERTKVQTVSVLDFGGACGAHYFATRVALPGRELRWCVVDTAPMVNLAARMATSELQFRSTISDAANWLGKVTVIHSSGTLQYLPDPLRSLRELISLKPALILLSRLGLVDGEPFTVIQRSQLSDNGPGPLPRGMRNRQVKYPVTFLSRKLFETIVSESYTIEAQYWDMGGDYRTTRGDIKGSCYLFLRRP